MCSTGKFQNETGKQSCYQCPIGKFANQTGVARCHSCPLGRKNNNYEGAVSKDECSICSKGMYTLHMLALQNVRFGVAGRFNVIDELQRDSCIACPIGRYISDPGVNARLT